jgi:hypothetical protein
MRDRETVIGFFRSGGQLRQVLRMLQAFLALIASGLLLLLVFSPQAERFCDDHSVGCGLLTGFISTAVLLLAGYFLLFSWTLRKARRSYVDVASEYPERFFPTPPRLRGGRLRQDDVSARAHASSRSRRGRARCGFVARRLSPARS